MKRESWLLLWRNGIALAVLLTAVAVLAAPHPLRERAYSVMSWLIVARFAPEIVRLWRPYYNVPLKQLLAEQKQAALRHKAPLFTPLEMASSLVMLVAITYRALF